MRCFARVTPTEPCSHSATTEIAAQHYCDFHAEAIVRAVRSGYLVYFIARNGLIKIGVSSDMESRTRKIGGRLLATESGGRRRESELHLQFAEGRVHGEWFMPVLGLVEYLRCRHRVEPASITDAA